MRPRSLDPLYARASELGMETGYWDVSGVWHDASPEAVLAVLAAMGAPVDVELALQSDAGLDATVAELAHHVHLRAARALAPVITVLDDATDTFALCWPDGRHGGRLRVELERDPASLDAGQAVLDVAEYQLDQLPIFDSFEADGRRWLRRVVPLAASLGVGYHELGVELDGQRFPSTVLRAPAHVDQPGPTDRLWGAMAPLYALREDDGSAPHLGHLDDLGRWLEDFGGRIVGTLPILAAYLDRPFEPSPYSPVSRQFWNELYLDVERLGAKAPEGTGASPARFDPAAR